MAITMTTATKNAANDAITAQVEVGAGPNGTIDITDGGFVVLATVDLLAPAFGASAGGVSTLLGVPLSNAAVAAGTAAFAIVNDKDGTEVYRGTVGTTSADFIIDSTTIAISDTVQINLHTITAP